MCNGKTSSSGVLANRKKNVRFEDDKLEEWYEIIAVSDNEKRAKWMSRADFIAINSDIRRAVQESVAKRLHDGCDGSEKCFRGLEALISSYRRVEIQAFIQDLLEMQEEYKLLGLPKLTGLQCFSENNSKSALERALQMANQDASEARRVYAEALILARQ